MKCDYNLTDLPYAVSPCLPMKNRNPPSKLIMNEKGEIEAYDEWDNFLFSCRGKVEKDGTLLVEHG